MSEPSDSFGEDLAADVSADERAQLWAVAEKLRDERPYPRAPFRAELHAHLLRRPLSGERPRALWARVGALALPGIVLLALVAAGVGHAGPFAP